MRLIGNQLGRGIYLGGIGGFGSAGPWILEAAAWNDVGVWDDTAIWKDV